MNLAQATTLAAVLRAAKYPASKDSLYHADEDPDPSAGFLTAYDGVYTFTLETGHVYPSSIADLSITTDGDLCRWDPDLDAFHPMRLVWRHRGDAVEPWRLHFIPRKTRWRTGEGASVPAR